MMRKGALNTAVSTASLAFLLSACGGGGGVVSTPTPPPITSPAPSPAPAPAPPPTGSNSDLLDPLASETFANAATRITASFDSNGTTGTAEAITATIIYDADTDSYSLSTPSGSITFRASDIDQSQSNDTVVVYVVTNGNTTHSLTLTRAGTSGPITYQYVGGAFWQRTVEESATSVTGSLDSIVYGAQTPFDDIPTTGTANYDIDLIGARTTSTSINPIAGVGTASVDFSTGSIIFIGTITLGGIQDGGDFFGDAQLSANENTFAGSFTFSDFQTFDGVLQGKLFGPAAEEIGASFAATDGTGAVAVGAILGRQGSGDPPNTQFNPGSGAAFLENSQTFRVEESSLDVNIAGNDGFLEDLGAFSDIATSTGPLAIRYDADRDQYVLINDDLSLVFSGSDPLTTFLGPTERSNLRTFAFDPRFNQRETQFVRHRSWFFARGANNVAETRFGHHIFGFATADSAIARTGSAGYAIRVNGTAVDDAFRNTLSFNGNGEFFVDLATGEITAFAPIDYGENVINAALTPESRLGSFRFTGNLSATANAFNGTVTMDGIGDYSGTGSGQFYGPNAEEVGGTFTASRGPGGSLVGGFVGLLDPSVTDPNAPASTLADYDWSSDLPFYVKDTIQFGGDVVGFRFDPDTGNYIVDRRPGGSNEIITDIFTPGDVNAGESSPTLDARTIVSGPDTVNTRLRIPSATPAITLTYTSFAEIGRQNGFFPNFNDRAYIVYGLPTRQMPRTGQGTYSGIAFGFAQVREFNGGTDFFDFTGDSTLTANFGEGTFDLAITSLVGTYLDQGNPQSTSFDGLFEDINFAGDIVGAELSQRGSRNGFSMQGGFFGPDAAEFGAVFEVFQRFDRNGAEFRIDLTGAATGKRD